MSWTRARARLAATERHHPDADTTDLRRELKAARAEDYIRRVVDSAPPLLPEQLAKIRALLPPAEASDLAEAS